MWYQVSQLSQQSAFCFHVTSLWQVPHGHRVILLLFCWLVGFVELFLFMPFGGNKLLLGTCTSLLLLMVFPKLFRLSNGLGDTNELLLKIEVEMLGIPHCMQSQLMLLAFTQS
jgi:hypothetical protein